MIPAGARILLCTDPTGIRYGFDRPANAVRSRLGQDPQQGGVLVR